MKKRNFLVGTLIAGMAALGLAEAQAATYNWTISKNPADGATTDTVQGAFDILQDGDVATFTILDSSTYQITSDLLDGFDNGTVYLTTPAGQFPTLAPQGNFDVFELDNNVGGTQLGDVNGGRIRISMGPAVGEHGTRIFFVRNDNTTPVKIENWLVNYDQSLSPGGGIVLYTAQNVDNPDVNAPPNELELTNVIFQVNGRNREGWRRQHPVNATFRRVAMLDVYRFAMWNNHDGGDARHSVDAENNALGDPGTISNYLSSWRTSGSGYETMRAQTTVGVTWNFDRALLTATADDANGIMHIRTQDTSINMKRTGLVYTGAGAAVPGIIDNAGDTAGDSLGNGWTIDHCEFYIPTTGGCINIADGATNRPISISNSNFYSAGVCIDASPAASSPLTLNFNNLYSTDVDLLASGDVYGGSASPGPNDVVPGQDPGYGPSVTFGNFTYANTFLQTADNTGGPIGINDNYSDLPGYVVPNQVKHWNLY